ncbi:MAG: endonuclease/exonuclease/phosphatase family protein [Anaerolineae bacterium]
MHKRSMRLIEGALVLLFAVQAVRTMLSMLFGRIYDAMFAGQGMQLLLAPGAALVAMVLLPLVSPTSARNARTSLFVAAALCAMARVPMTVDQASLRLFTAVAVLAAAGVYVAGLMRAHASLLAPAFSLAFVADQLLRALGHTYDLSLRSWWLVPQAALSLALIALAALLLWGKGEPEPTDESRPAGFGAGLAFGAALFAATSLFALPNAASRWTLTGYGGMVISLMALSAIPLFSVVSGLPAGTRGVGSLLLRLLALFAGLAGLMLADRMERATAAASLLVAAAVFWALLPSSLRVVGQGRKLGMVLGMLAFLLLSVAHAMSYTYAYAFPSFEGAALPAFLAAAVVALVPGMLQRVAAHARTASLLHPATLIGGLLGCLLAAGLAAFPQAPVLRAAGDLKLATYNIHYGYDSDWRLSLEEQARTIEESGADVVALQEVDTGRLTSYGVDDALWLAERLAMRVIYLPTVEHTTGIALLSRVELTDAGGRLLPSEGEPTGILKATVSMGGLPLRVHAVWLGLSPEERARQLAPALEYVGTGRVALAGDMNDTPDSATHASMVAAGFGDPFHDLSLGDVPTDPAVNPTKRIDYVWLRGLEATEAQVLTSEASDHRMVVVGVR